MKAKFRFVIWFFMIFVAAGISLYLDLKYFPVLLRNVYFHIITFILGVFLLWAVLRISRKTGKTLAKYGREGNIPRFETNKLVDKGVYAYMRHPMHLGLLFFPLSVALIAGLPVFIFFIAPMEMIFMLLMIKFVEEPEAIKKFGSTYEQYAKNKPWFCLRLKCLKELLF